VTVIDGSDRDAGKCYLLSGTIAGDHSDMTEERILESMTGERIVVKESTPGLLRFERYLPPKQRPVPKVAHPTQSARLKVLQGRLHTAVGAQTREYGPGESFDVPAGTFHSAWNVDAQEALVLVEFSPAEGLLPFFEEVMGLTSMNPLGITRIIKHHPGAVRLPAPYAQMAGLLGLFVR
jgi:quercetin dioxygenase-like cupin family protein